MVFYRLMAMKRGQARPTVIAVRTDDWKAIMPLWLCDTEAGRAYETVEMGPLLIPQGWLCWIDHSDAPAYAAR